MGRKPVVPAKRATEMEMCQVGSRLGDPARQAFSSLAGRGIRIKRKVPMQHGQNGIVGKVLRLVSRNQDDLIIPG